MSDRKALSGVIVVTAPSDWLFAKGCLASLRWFMPNTPVALLIDGEVDAGAAEKTYGTQVLRVQDIPDRWLRENSFGWGLTKMTAIWHSPFEHYLYLDADTVIWGDLHAKIFDTEQDVVWSIPKAVRGDPHAYVNTWFFDPKEVAKRWPAFHWERHVASFACSGTFFLRRNCLRFERYRELLTAANKSHDLFKFGEMGILNLMIFEQVEAGALRLKKSDFQVIFPDYSQDSLRQRFQFDDHETPVVNSGDEQVLHMPDNKPLIDNPQCYSQPMSFFRLMFLRDTEGITGDEALRRLRAEDDDYARLRAEFLRQEKNKKIRGLLEGKPSEWRRLAAKLAHRVTTIGN